MIGNVLKKTATECGVEGLADIRLRFLLISLLSFGFSAIIYSILWWLTSTPENTGTSRTL